MGITITSKKISGHTYYYARECKRVDGRPQIVWQKYLGKSEDIVKLVESGGDPPEYAEIFEYGLSSTLWKECVRTQVVSLVDEVCPKRKQSLSVGDYIAVAAINRAMTPVSKHSMWDWFSGTSMLHYIPDASEETLSSQRFWDHMDRITQDDAHEMWRRIIKATLKIEKIDLSSVSYDGTNFYTFIDTFNMNCTTAKRGKNKQGRSNLRQIGYALFCTSDGHIPLMYDVYEGNRNDAKQFKEMVNRFGRFAKDLCAKESTPPDITLIFDKGNNSENNFALIDSLDMKFVGSVKLDQVKELTDISNQDSQFYLCQSPELEGAKAFRVTRELYGKQRTVVVTYNQNLFNAQWLTIQNDIESAMKKLDELSQRLIQRESGVIRKGAAIKEESVHRQCMEICGRQHMKDVIRFTIARRDGHLHLVYEIDAEALARLADTWLGKNILISNRDDWNDDQIIHAYRSQYIIEDVFKEMKDRQTGSWWPLFHWTDSKIQVHGLYCTIALLLRALVHRKIRKAGIPVSMKRMLSELIDIRQVVNVFPAKRKGQKERRQTVLSKTSELQQRLLELLGLEGGKQSF
jgi:transposase